MPVYLIRAGEDGPVKIGRATNVVHRMANLQCGHYQKLVLLRTLDHDEPAKAEAWLHRKFLSMRIIREWFRFHHTMLTIHLPADFSISPAVPRSMPEWFYETPSQRRRKRSRLDEWLEDKGITRLAFAARLGVPPSYVAERCCARQALPSPEIIRRIERETDAEVTVADFREGARRVFQNDSKRTGVGYSQRTQEHARFVLTSGALAS